MEPEVQMDEYERYRRMKKGLRRRFSTVGWVLLIYMGIMNVAVIATMISQLVMEIQRSILAGVAITPETVMENLPDGAGGYIAAVVIGLLLLFIWKKPDFWKQEIFARGKPMTIGSFFRILSVFLSCQFVYQILMTGVEMVLNVFGLSVLEGMQAVSIDTDNFAMFLYGGILAPITEEILFRGVIQRTLMPWGKRFAILCSAFVFGIFHGNLLQTPFAFVVGLVLGYVACEYNIVWAMILHMVNNLVLGDTLYRIGELIGPYAGDYITSVILLLAGIGALVIMIRYREQIRSYRRENPVYGMYVGCFFSGAGNIVLMVCMAISMVISLFGMITQL